MNSRFRSLVPRPLLRLTRTWFGWRWFRGRYPTWREARAAAGGYDSRVIVDRVLAAVLAVKAGRAAYERDGVLFPETAFDEPLLDALRFVADANGGRLRTLDFGGALGSNYWRHRSWLSDRAELCWDIVEQPQFVAAGRQHLSDTPLRFFTSVEEAEAAARHDVLLCATALQYLEDPFSTLATWIDHGWPYLLFNNLPLHHTAPNYVTVQHVPPAIYPATYPVWFFNRERFLSRFEGRYETVREFTSEAVWPMGWKSFPSTGLLLRKTPRP